MQVLCSVQVSKGQFMSLNHVLANCSLENWNEHQFVLKHSWQFFARFLYGASVHLNHHRCTPVHLSNRVIAFNQSKRSEWFRRILCFINLRLKWQCSKRTLGNLGRWENTREAREALGFALCHSNAFLLLSQLPTCIHNSIDAHQAGTIS